MGCKQLNPAIRLEDVFELRAVAVEAVAPALFVQGDMHGDHKRSGGGNEGKILSQPFQLVLDQGSIVIPYVAGLSIIVRSRGGIGALHVIQHNVVNLAYVEGIIRGPYHFLVLFNRIEIPGLVHAVVMVADSLINGKAGDGLRIGQVFPVSVIIGFPVQVPGHVAQGHSINLTCSLGDVTVDIGHKIPELLAVVGAVGQVDIAQHEHGVVFLADGFVQGEVYPFRRTDARRELPVNHGKDAATGGLIPGRYAHEHISVILLGRELISSVLVRLHRIDAIGHYGIRDALTATDHFSVNGGTGCRLEFLCVIGLYYHLHLPHLPAGGSTVQRHIVQPIAERLAPQGTDVHIEGSCADIQNGTGAQASQGQVVAGRRRFGKLYTEGNGTGAIGDFHLFRDSELDAFQ